MGRNKILGAKQINARVKEMTEDVKMRAYDLILANERL